MILVIMSATLQAEPAAEFLGNCPIVRVEGRTFPVEVEYRGQPNAVSGVGAKYCPLTSV